MKKDKYFNRIEAKILRLLYQQKTSLTIYEVAKDCGISHPTAKKYLEKLKKDKLIDIFKLPDTSHYMSRDEYKFNFKVFKGEKPKKKK